MNINNRIAPTLKLSDSGKTLKPGQIVQGKVLKLYPHQKADIQ